MRLQWIGQACFHISSQDGRSLLIDPFQRVIGLPRGDFPANVVLFTHSHLDHFDPSAVPANASIVMGPGFHRVGGFDILGVQAFHDRKEGLLSGEVTLYSFVVDGFRVVHLADLGDDIDGRTMAALGRPHVLLFPAGEHTTLSLEEIAHVVERINPAIAIPMSFHVPGLQMPAATIEDVIVHFPNHRRVARLDLAPGQKLAARTEIRILDAVSYPALSARSG